MSIAVSVNGQKQLVDAVLSHFCSDVFLDLLSAYRPALNYADYHLQIENADLVQAMDRRGVCCLSARL